MAARQDGHGRVVAGTATGGAPDTCARPAPISLQLIGRFFFFNPSCCSIYDSPFVIQSGAGSPFR